MNSGIVCVGLVADLHVSCPQNWFKVKQKLHKERRLESRLSWNAFMLKVIEVMHVTDVVSLILLIKNNRKC